MCSLFKRYFGGIDREHAVVLRSAFREAWRMRQSNDCIIISEVNGCRTQREDNQYLVHQFVFILAINKNKHISFILILDFPVLTDGLSSDVSEDERSSSVGMETFRSDELSARLIILCHGLSLTRPINKTCIRKILTKFPPVKKYGIALSERIKVTSKLDVKPNTDLKANSSRSTLVSKFIDKCNPLGDYILQTVTKIIVPIAVAYLIFKFGINPVG